MQQENIVQCVLKKKKKEFCPTKERRRKSHHKVPPWLASTLPSQGRQLMLSQGSWLAEVPGSSLQCQCSRGSSRTERLELHSAIDSS